MTRITIQPDLVVDAQDLKRFEALYFLPGEKVKVDLESNFGGESDEDFVSRTTPLAGRDLLIKESRLSKEDDLLHLHYVFDGFDGEHNAGAFMNYEGSQHHYGTLITRHEQMWLVPMERYDAPVAGKPLLIDGDLSRAAKYCFGIDGKNNTDEGFFAGHQDEPSTGEYYWHVS